MARDLVAYLHGEAAGTLRQEDSGRRDHTDRMAMKIGGKNRFSQVLPRHWQRFARDAGLASPRVRRDLLALAERLPAEARLLADEFEVSPRSSAPSIVGRIVHAIESHAELVRRTHATP